MAGGGTSDEAGRVGSHDAAGTVVDPPAPGTGARAGATALDPLLPGAAARDAGTTSLDPGLPGTHVDGPDLGLGPTVVWARVNLPPGLAARYRVEGELPGGAEADVLLCTDLESGEPRVIKLYRSRSTALDDAMLELVQTDESFPHVVRSYEWGTEHGTWFEIQEYVPNGSLADLLDAEGPVLDQARAREVLEELHAALSHVHDRGIVHRDLKPQNVLVRTVKPLDLVLADFGLATVVEKSRTMRSGSRTPAYGAPEAAWGDVSSGRDWWSVGIILVELLTGEHPFRRADGTWMEDAEIGNHLSTRPIDLTAIEDPRWRLVTRGLLVRDPADRWSDDQVRRWLTGETPNVADDQQTAPSAAGASPYAFEGKVYSEVATLAGAFSDNWNAARRLLAGARSDDTASVTLRSWLIDMDSERAARIVTEAGSPEQRLCRLLVAMAPDRPPVFGGHRMDLAGALELAATATAGDEIAAKVLTAAYEANALGAYAGCAGHEDLAEVNAAWRHTVENLLPLHAQLPGYVREAIDPALGATRAAALLASFSPEAAEKVADSARAVSTAEARTVTWFTKHLDAAEALGSGLAADLITVAVGPLAASEATQTRIAAEQRRRIEEDQRREARRESERQAEQSRRTRRFRRPDEDGLESVTRFVGWPWTGLMALGGLGNGGAGRAQLIPWLIGLIALAALWPRAASKFLEVLEVQYGRYGKRPRWGWRGGLGSLVFFLITPMSVMVFYAVLPAGIWRMGPAVFLIAGPLLALGTLALVAPRRA